MAKNGNTAKASTGRTFAPAKVGAAKATKFALVEGIKLNAKSASASALTQSRGLKGDAYRQAITETFRGPKAR